MARKRQTRTGDFAPVVIADGPGTRTVSMRWGFEPSDGKKPRFLVREDSPEVERRARCLIPATGLPLTDRDGGRWAVTLAETGDLFCFAGLWEQATETWSASYAAVTVPAYPDLNFIKRRHIAILPQCSWVTWLGGAPTSSVLLPLPRGMLKVRPA